MANPLASIWEDLPTPMPKAKTEVKPKPKIQKDHSEARAIYEEYLAKREVLIKHRAYALEVVKATGDSRGMTPVKPLATMGTDGGPLLCDHCFKPILLEGGAYNRMPVDVAWAKNPERELNWVSYISGGLVVEIAENGTLRIYHGYIGRSGHCCNVAKAEQDKEIEAFKKDHSKIQKIYEFLRDELNDTSLLGDIVNTMFSYDPGLGVNKPCGS